MTLQNETPEQFTQRAKHLLQEALRLCRRDDGDESATFSHCMSQAKAQRMTWVEGLEFTILRRCEGGCPARLQETLLTCRVGTPHVELYRFSSWYTFQPDTGPQGHRTRLIEEGKYERIHQFY